MHYAVYLTNNHPSYAHTTELLASRTVHCCAVAIVLPQRLPLGRGFPPAAGGTLGHQHRQGEARLVRYHLCHGNETAAMEACMPHL